MGAMKTPGVYVVEKNSFPSSVVEVATAVPAFIGYTEKAINGGKSLTNVPWRITSLSEYLQYFGGAPEPQFDLSPVVAEPAAPAEGDEEASEGEAAASTASTVAKGNFTLVGDDFEMEQSKGKFSLYYNLRLFFENGGGPCYIVSVNNYKNASDEENDLDPDLLKKAFDELVKEQEPTIIVIPDAINLAKSDCVSVQQASLMHCGNTMKNRVAILDIYDGEKDRKAPSGDCVETFRTDIGSNFLDYGMTYYPWLNTTVVQDNELSYSNLTEGGRKTLRKIVTEELLGSLVTQYNGLEGSPKIEGDLSVTAASTEPFVLAEESDEQKAFNANNSNAKSLYDKISKIYAEIDKISAPYSESLNKVLITLSPKFNAILTEIKERLNILPPSSAMAGIYTMVDNNYGVWKAPANVSLNSVISPTVNITHENQEDLNVPISGKAVNAIRPFIGEGTLVWGARTLDGNSLDWRYISVRRTMIMLEESVRLAAKTYVFENNTANTWVTIKAMISNFLDGIWKRGGLAGSSPEDAFSVSVGLGETMTPTDILEGIMRITVKVALIRPAEFIEITFQQQMQKS